MLMMEMLHGLFPWPKSLCLPTCRKRHSEANALKEAGPCTGMDGLVVLAEALEKRTL